MQELMKAGKVPDGYRRATDAECVKLNGASFSIERIKLKLEAAMAKKLACDEALKNVERDIEELKIQFARSVEYRKKVDQQLGINPQDAKAVLEDGTGGLLIRESAKKPETKEERIKTLKAKLEGVQQQEAEIGAKLLDDPSYDPGEALLTGLLTLKQSTMAELASLNGTVGFASPPPPGVAAPGVEFEVTRQ